MFKTIADPADCEVRSVIRFLNAKKVKPAEIHRQLVEVYGENVMTDGMERLLLSVLPRFVVMEMIRDMASDEDEDFQNNRKILSAQQFHRIYIHCYDHVR
ncbi:hypothetical protein AVEN_149823-1 [Araneus ventricosus]|uniref:Mos1 transposase HTH domain-containing protein n=1 Tax=Araneus ventricosus TaxID=182803 RepID=A0A4Y2RVC1_ARAVE|nr:hypothetical protein AVEN_149823-1 [Araneus ventricosus]